MTMTRDDMDKAISTLQAVATKKRRKNQLNPKHPGETGRNEGEMQKEKVQLVRDSGGKYSVWHIAKGTYVDGERYTSQTAARREARKMGYMVAGKIEEL